MRKLGVLLSIILCGVILVFSYASWKDKLAAAGKPAPPSEAAAPAEETTEEQSAVSEEVADIDLESLTAGMDPQVQELLSNRKEQGEKVQLLVLGSEAMEAGQPGYSELFTEAIDTAYGGFIETEVMNFEGTSEEFLMTAPQLSAGYDVVLLEPFTLKNNGRIEIETEHLHIQNVFGEILTATGDAVLVLHPPQPIYGAQFYLTQVTALEEFAATQNYAYINHWEQWPSTEDLTLQTYLTEESNPNNLGAETWANALIAYFTGS
ncbi:SGNH/GDSL hydrolase family protein [Planococcus sp. X10-3]|uniref:SGNH/GDSL hydrolase family protein n=1 Tax=Planococcus sp. X10-3 TaxID=3061240 RepID=UPI003BB206CF